MNLAEVVERMQILHCAPMNELRQKAVRIGCPRIISNQLSPFRTCSLQCMISSRVSLSLFTFTQIVYINCIIPIQHCLFYVRVICTKSVAKVRSVDTKLTQPIEPCISLPFRGNGCVRLVSVLIYVEFLCRFGIYSGFFEKISNLMRKLVVKSITDKDDTANSSKSIQNVKSVRHGDQKTIWRL